MNKLLPVFWLFWLGWAMTGCRLQITPGLDNTAGVGTKTSTTTVLPKNPPAAGISQADRFVIDHIHPLRFTRHSIDEGLSQSSVQAILQDQKGLMWLGTEDGLNRYDGYDYRVFRSDPNDPESLSHSNIRVLYEDDSANIWIGTYGGGLNRYDPVRGKFQRYEFLKDNKPDPGSKRILAITQDNQGWLWLGSEGGGLIRMDPQSGEYSIYTHQPDQADSLSSDTIVSILQDSDGRVWIGTTTGLDRWQPETDRFIHYPLFENLPEEQKYYFTARLVEDAAGWLWIGTQQGLIHFDPGSGRFEHFKHNPDDSNSLADNEVRSIELDAAGGIWIGTFGGGLDYFNPLTRQFTHSTHNSFNPFSLSNNFIYSLYKDRDGAIWVGTFGGGVNYLQPSMQRFSTYYPDPFDPASISAAPVMGIFEAGTNTVWVATFGGGLNRLDRSQNTFSHYRNNPKVAESLISDEVWDVYGDRAGNLWVGTQAGLDKLDPDTGVFTHYQHIVDDESSLSNNVVLAIAEGQSGDLWVGTDLGLNRYNPESGTFQRYLHDPNDPYSLSHDAVWQLYVDPQGGLWVGTNGGGLNRFDPETGKFKRYQNDPQVANSLSNDTILSIYQDRKGRLWVGTWGGGLNLLDPESGKAKTYTLQDGLPNETVYGILEDGDGMLWLSTNNGIARFDPESGSFENYNVADGLQSNEFNFNSAYLSRRGEMFFGGINGLTAFFPEAIINNTTPPPVVLTSITQGGQSLQDSVSIEYQDEVTLAWPNNYFEFKFSGLNYFQSAINQYAYYLEGFDKDWIYNGTNRVGRYTNLPGGSYTLRMKAANNDGLWNEAGASLIINVLPPWWETWWFRGLLGVLVIGLVTVAYRLRTRTVEERNLELEYLVRERTQDLTQKTSQLLEHTELLEKRNQLVETQRNEIEALYNADEILHQHMLSLEQTLQALVTIAVDILKADKGSLMVWNETHDRLVVCAAKGFDPQTLPLISLQPGEGIAGRVVQDGKPALIEDTSQEPYVTRSIIDREGICSLMQIPVEVRGEIFGVISADYTSLHKFRDEEVRLLMAFAKRAGLAIENAQLNEQARQMAVVEERNRLARELHDSAKQKAFAALAQLGAADNRLMVDSATAQIHLREAESLVHEVLQDLIILIEELRPGDLQQKGLPVALRDYIYEWDNRESLQATLFIDEDVNLPFNMEQALYRIAQEALSNISRHSHAENAEIALSSEADNVILEIHDDGIGFSPQNVQAGFGMRSIHERVTQLGGKLQVDSEPGKGTRITVQIQRKRQPNP